MMGRMIGRIVADRSFGMEGRGKRVVIWVLEDAVQMTMTSTCGMRGECGCMVR